MSLLRDLRIVFRNWLLKPETPGPIYLVSVRTRDAMAKLLGNMLAIPPVTVGDIAVRKLTVKVGDADAVSVDLKPTDAQYEVVAGDNVVFTVSLVDVDQDGNVSEPSTATFTSKDTVPPPKPGEFHVAAVREIDNTVPAATDQPGTASPAPTAEGTPQADPTQVK